MDHPLVALGFTGLEAAVYTFLVQESPATGYRVSQAIGKPIANTYKAIESLQKKGAVVADETGSKQCRAVPPDELLQQLEDDFSRQHERASKALAKLRPASDDDGIYSITSRDLVYERFRTMLAQAAETVLVDLFPHPLAHVAKDLEACAARGVNVTALVYEPVTIPGVETVGNIQQLGGGRQWPGDWLNAVVDGSEMLLAFMEADGHGVLQGISSRSPYLCWAYQSALAGEILAACLQHGIEADASRDELQRTIERFKGFRAHESIGFRNLTERPS